MDALTSIPSTITAGTTVILQRSFGSYPVTSFTYKFHLAGPSVASASGVVSGSVWLVTLTATVTGALAVGAYRYSERVTDTGTGEVAEAGSGVIEVLPNLATATAGSLQTHDERMLVAIESVLEGRASADVQIYTIGGRSITKIPIEELARLQSRYAARVWRQKHPTSFGPDTLVYLP